MTKRVGTSFYMAPEVISSNFYDNKCDVFSYSIISYQLLFTTKDPFGNVENQGIEQKISEDSNLRPLIPEEMKEKEKGLIEVIKSCWEHNPKKRPNFKDILSKLEEFELDESVDKIDLSNTEQIIKKLYLENQKLKIKNKELEEQVAVYEKEKKEKALIEKLRDDPSTSLSKDEEEGKLNVEIVKL